MPGIAAAGSGAQLAEFDIQFVVSHQTIFIIDSIKPLHRGYCFPATIHKSNGFNYYHLYFAYIL